MNELAEFLSRHPRPPRPVSIADVALVTRGRPTVFWVVVAVAHGLVATGAIMRARERPNAVVVLMFGLALIVLTWIGLLGATRAVKLGVLAIARVTSVPTTIYSHETIAHAQGRATRMKLLVEGPDGKFETCVDVQEINVLSDIEGILSSRELVVFFKPGDDFIHTVIGPADDRWRALISAAHTEMSRSRGRASAKDGR